MRTFTKSLPRTLLSITKSKSARSRSRCSRSNIKQISQISFGFSGRLAPSFFPAFQAGPRSTGSYDECPSSFSVRRISLTMGLRRLLWPAEQAGRFSSRAGKTRRLFTPELNAGKAPSAAIRAQLGPGNVVRFRVGLMSAFDPNAHGVSHFEEWRSAHRVQAIAAAWKRTAGVGRGLTFDRIS